MSEAATPLKQRPDGPSIPIVGAPSTLSFDLDEDDDVIPSSSSPLPLPPKPDTPLLSLRERLEKIRSNSVSPVQPEEAEHDPTNNPEETLKPQHPIAITPKDDDTKHVDNSENLPSQTNVIEDAMHKKVDIELLQSDDVNAEPKSAALDDSLKENCGNSALNVANVTVHHVAEDVVFTKKDSQHFDNGKRQYVSLFLPYSDVDLQFRT